MGSGDAFEIEMRSHFCLPKCPIIMHFTIGVAVIAFLWIWRRGRRRRQLRHANNRKAKSHPPPAAIVVNAQNVELYLRIWSTPQPNAVVLLIHGHTSDGSSFSEVAEALTQRSFEAVSYDWQGHGNSGSWQSTRGDVQKFEHLVSDAEKIVLFIKREYPLVPVFILGDGYGATVGLFVSLRCRLDGLVLCSAMILPDVDPHPPSTITSVLFALEKLLPEMLISTNGTMKGVHETQPTLRSMIQAHRGLHRLKRRLQHVTTPFVVMHGTLDAYVNVQHARTLFAEAKAQEKRLMIYDRMGSCLFAEREDDRSQVMTDVLAWLDERTCPRGETRSEQGPLGTGMASEAVRSRRRIGYWHPRALRRLLP